MKTYLNRGFTLIELLVVIAIIGILSSVVLASLNTARGKGSDTAVKANLANVRAQAEIIYDRQSCYSSDESTACAAAAVNGVTACPAVAAGTAGTLFRNDTVANQIASAKAASGGLTACASTANQAAWAIAVQLKQDLKTAWCVDSTGVSKQIGDASAYTQATLTSDVSGGVCGS